MFGDRPGCAYREKYRMDRYEEPPKYGRVRKASQGSRYPSARGNSNVNLKLALDALAKRVEILEQYKRDQINN